MAPHHVGAVILTFGQVGDDTFRLDNFQISGVVDMDAKALRDLARRYQDNKEFITNEEMTKASLIVPFITALGYDTSNPREVRLEYAAEFTANDGKKLPNRMDYAIFDTARQAPFSSLANAIMAGDSPVATEQVRSR
jgi:predicted type IV restriction endonuclease